MDGGGDGDGFGEYSDAVAELGDLIGGGLGGECLGLGTDGGVDG